MRARFSFATGAWAAATAAASLISWAGVQIVTSAVTPSPVAVVPSSQIHPVSQPAATGPTFTPALSAVPVIGAGAVAPSTLAAAPVAPSAASAAAQPSAPATATTATPQAVQPTTAPYGHATTTVTPPPSSPPSTAAMSATPSPTTSTTAPPTTSSGSVAEYSTPGGNATFRCNGSVVSLVSASPANGYQMYVDSTEEPGQVQVDFVNAQYEDSITATCVNGQPSAQTSVRSHDGGFGGGLNNRPSSGQTTSRPDTASASSATTAPGAG